MSVDLPSMPPDVRAAFEVCPPEVRARLHDLRALVFTTAEQTEGVGPLEEALRWGEPSYLTTQTRSGSAVRLGWKPRQPDEVAVLFHCRTGLVERFRTLFHREFRFQGNRAILLGVDGAFDRDALAFCIAASLRCRLDRRAS